MSVKIQKEFTFMSGVHFDNRFIINLYEMNAVMSVETMNTEDQNTAINRISYFFNYCIENCIFINESHHEQIEKYEKAGLRVCLIPEEPYDQIIGLILINKCNSIMEDKVIITDIVFGSKLNNFVRFELDIETAETFSGENWWNCSSLCIENSKLEKKVKEGKIVKLFDNKKDEWASLELTWSTL